MRKVALTVLLSLVTLAGLLYAQNNPYNIDDECFKYFHEVEMLYGKDGFKEAADKLLLAAVSKGDTKARVLYYVAQLKDGTSRYLDVKTTTEDDDRKIDALASELRKEARDLGYKQYFYYAYELLQNYYYNHDKQVKTMELLREMQDVAIEDGDAYGLWLCNRYLVALYINQNDYVSAKRYILNALRIYDESTDPTIRNQSVARLYCDLSDTYPIGNDSVPINLRKAVANSKVHMDTLRCQYHLAKLTAYNKQIEAYEKARDFCLRDPSIERISPTARQLFESIDLLINKGGDGAEEFLIKGSMVRLREVKYLANIAEVYGYKELAFAIEKKIVALEEKKLSEANQHKLAEMEARLGNDRLSADLALKEGEVARFRMLIVAFVIFAAAIAILSLIIRARSLRKKNRQLAEANEKVMVANAAKTRFVQNMSHEIRTPLNAIVGFSQLLSLPDGSFSPEEKNEFSGHIINNTKMLTMLLDDILNITAMDSGNYKIHFDEGEVHFICKAAISSSEHRLQPGVTMHYVPESEAPFTFRTDPHRVQQILINLLTNACKHTKEGTITLSSSLSENPGRVTFAVTDTGSGIPADQAEKIFERFTKLDEFVQGTGLGLSICRDIASRMGGEVYLDTTYQGKGSRFVFTLPIDYQPEDSNT